MKQLAMTHRKELETYTDLDLTAIDKITYLHDFDREVQYVVAHWQGLATVGGADAVHRCPTWGYPTEYAYYRDASSTDAVLGIRIPFVALQATDDPVCCREHRTRKALSDSH